MLQFTAKLSRVSKYNQRAQSELTNAKAEYDTFTDEEKGALDAFPLDLVGVPYTKLSELMGSLDELS